MATKDLSRGGKNLTTAQAGDCVGISPRHFCRLASRHGITPVAGCTRQTGYYWTQTAILRLVKLMGKHQTAAV